MTVWEVVPPWVRTRPFRRDASSARNWPGVMTSAMHTASSRKDRLLRADGLPVDLAQQVHADVADVEGTLAQQDAAGGREHRGEGALRRRHRTRRRRPALADRRKRWPGTRDPSPPSGARECTSASTPAGEPSRRASSRATSRSSASSVRASSRAASAGPASGIEFGTTNAPTCTARPSAMPGTRAVPGSDLGARFREHARQPDLAGARLHHRHVVVAMSGRRPR